jgi:hypothetical protein
MTKDDMLLFAKTVRTIEKLHFDNLALEVLAEKYAPRNWKSLVDELAGDELLHPEVRERFRLAYAELEREQSPNRSVFVELLRSLPAHGKPN